MVLFSADGVRRGTLEGDPRKSKVESLFSGGRDDNDPRVFNTTFINNEICAQTRY